MAAVLSSFTDHWDTTCVGAPAAKSAQVRPMIPSPLRFSPRAVLQAESTTISALRLRSNISRAVRKPSSPLFGSGSANLSKDGKVALAEVAQVLASIEKRSFQVEGHTDNVPIATAQYPSNWELASARAINVLKAMIESGLPSGRVSAASFGDSRPSVANDSAEGKAQNRRIEIIIVPDLSGLPGFDELQKAEKAG